MKCLACEYYQPPPFDAKFFSILDACDNIIVRAVIDHKMKIYDETKIIHIIDSYKILYILAFTDSPFDLERCGPAVDLALERVNEEFLKSHKIQLRKVQRRYVYIKLLCRYLVQ